MEGWEALRELRAQISAEGERGGLPWKRKPALEEGAQLSRRKMMPGGLARDTPSAWLSRAQITARQPLDQLRYLTF